MLCKRLKFFRYTWVFIFYRLHSDKLQQENDACEWGAVSSKW